MEKREIVVRVNQLEYTKNGTVTTSAQQIESIFTDIPAQAKDNMSTLVIHNVSSNVVYFGADNTVTTSNGGGVIDANESREIPFKNLERSPWFIAGGNSEIRIEVWS